MQLSGLDYAWIHLLGFSQGGTVALMLSRLFRGEQKLGSCAAISAALLPETLRSVGFTPQHWHQHSKEVAAASHQVWLSWPKRLVITAFEWNTAFE